MVGLLILVYRVRVFCTFLLEAEGFLVQMRIRFAISSTPFLQTFTGRFSMPHAPLPQFTSRGFSELLPKSLLGLWSCHFFGKLVSRLHVIQTRPMRLCQRPSHRSSCASWKKYLGDWAQRCSLFFFSRHWAHQGLSRSGISGADAEGR